MRSAGENGAVEQGSCGSGEAGTNCLVSPAARRRAVGTRAVPGGDPTPSGRHSGGAAPERCRTTDEKPLVGDVSLTPLVGLVCVAHHSRLHAEQAVMSGPGVGCTGLAGCTKAAANLPGCRRRRFRPRPRELRLPAHGTGACLAASLPLLVRRRSRPRGTGAALAVDRVTVRAAEAPVDHVFPAGDRFRGPKPVTAGEKVIANRGRGDEPRPGAAAAGGCVGCGRTRWPRVGALAAGGHAAGVGQLGAERERDGEPGPGEGRQHTDPAAAEAGQAEVAVDDRGHSVAAKPIEGRIAPSPGTALLGNPFDRDGTTPARVVRARRGRNQLREVTRCGACMRCAGMADLIRSAAQAPRVAACRPGTPGAGQGSASFGVTQS